MSKNDDIKWVIFLKDGSQNRLSVGFSWSVLNAGLEKVEYLLLNFRKTGMWERDDVKSSEVGVKADRQSIA